MLEAFELSQDGRGERASISYLEEQAVKSKGALSDEAMAALQRGWNLGDRGFRDRLLELSKPKGQKTIEKGSVTAVAQHAHDDEAAAEKR